MAVSALWASRSDSGRIQPRAPEAISALFMVATFALPLFGSAKIPAQSGTTSGEQLRGGGNHCEACFRSVRLWRSLRRRRVAPGMRSHPSSRVQPRPPLAPVGEVTPIGCSKRRTAAGAHLVIAQRGVLLRSGVTEIVGTAHQVGWEPR